MNPDDMDQLLVNLKLRRIREVLMRELQRAAQVGCSHQETLTRLLQEEWLDRQERRQKYRLEQAKLPEHWEIETFPFAQQPGVNAAQIRRESGLCGDGQQLRVYRRAWNGKNRFGDRDFAQSAACRPQGGVYQSSGFV